MSGLARTRFLRSALLAGGLTAGACTPPVQPPAPTRFEPRPLALGTSVPAAATPSVAGAPTDRRWAPVPPGKPRPPGAPAGTAAGDPAPPETPEALQTAIDRALGARVLEKAHVGVFVRDLEDGRVLYRRNEHDLLNPASNVKLFSTVAALSLLGPAHRYATVVYAGAPPDDRGVVKGPLYVQGHGDPALTTGDLYELAGRLYALGVRGIEGGIVVDNGAFEADRLPPGFDQKDEFAAYRPKVGAFAVNFNTFVVRVVPGSKAGAPATVRVDPPVRPVRLATAKVTTTDGWKRKVTVTHEDRPGDRIDLSVTGTIGVRARPLSYRFPVPDPSIYAGEVLRLVLRQRGIRIGRRSVRVGRVPRGSRQLASHLSPALAELVRGVNKHSNNFMAEQILYGLDEARPATFDGALARVRAFWADLGIGPAKLRLGNGSGLYDTNRASAAAVVALLEHAHRDFRLAPDFEASLPIAGVDGTTRRRLRESPARGWVRAKTGTLDGVSALSGYAGALGRAPIAFAILVNGLGKWQTQAARRVQDAIAADLAAYAAATAATTDPPPRSATRPIENARVQ